MATATNNENKEELVFDVDSLNTTLTSIAKSLQEISVSLQIIANDEDGVWEKTTRSTGTAEDTVEEVFFNAETNLSIPVDSSSQEFTKHKVPKVLWMKNFNKGEE